MRFLRWIKGLFKRNNTSPVKETPVVVIEEPKETKPKEEVTIPPIEAPVDTVNKGNPARPDWSYLWQTCTLDSNRVAEIKTVCAKIEANFSKYKEVELATGVPWKLIGAIHYREASLNFKTCLHNGDPLPGPTYHVPRNRGPFSSWSEAAIDALKYDGLHKIKFDSMESQLIMAEKYNGLGMRNKGEYTPYVWAGTNHSDETGKYVADGRYSSTAQEKQLGVAAILKGLEAV
jgi:lysozyme family protein